MTPERVTALVLRWVRWYTRGLPASTAERRIGEIDADLHDHVAHERADGAGERRIALGLAARMVRGMAADASWRGRTLARSSTRKDMPKMARLDSRSVKRVALATALILLVPLLLMQVSTGTDWGVFDFVFAAVLLGGTGLILELAAKNVRSLVYRVAAGAIGVAAIVFGEMDDAPGLVGFGLLLILGAIALSVRTAVRSA